MTHDTTGSPKFDQDRLCCGHLLEAEVVEGEVLLRCLACSTLWARSALGVMEPRPPTAPPE